MSAQRGDGRAQIKRIILVAFIAIIASVEFGLYPFSSSVDFRSERPRRYPRWHPRRTPARARARERSLDTHVLVHRIRVLADGRRVRRGVRVLVGCGFESAVRRRMTMVNVRAKRVGPIGLVSTRMYTYSVNTRTGVAAQSLMTRISMGCGKELPAHTAAEQSLMSLTLPTQTLAKMPGAVGEKGTIDLVIRVKVWNNPFHVVFKDELYDLLTIIAGGSFALVCTREF